MYETREYTKVHYTARLGIDPPVTTLTVWKDGEPVSKPFWSREEANDFIKRHRRRKVT